MLEEEHGSLAAVAVKVPCSTAVPHSCTLHMCLYGGQKVLLQSVSIFGKYCFELNGSRDVVLPRPLPLQTYPFVLVINFVVMSRSILQLQQDFGF